MSIASTSNNDFAKLWVQIIIVTNPNKILLHHSASAPRHHLACQKDIISDKVET